MSLPQWVFDPVMILEVARLDVKPMEIAAFEEAFQRAAPLISITPGYLSHELHRCIETPNRYVLLVYWESLEDHEVGFRRSDRYGEWKALLHHFYAPLPLVEHYEPFLRFGSAQV